MTTVDSPEGTQVILDSKLTALSELGVRARAELDQLDAERDELKRQIQALDEKRNTYRRVLNALAPPISHLAKDKPKAKPTTRKGLPVKKTLLAIQSGIKILADEGITEFSVRQAWEAQGGSGTAPWHDSFRQLREVGYLGKAGVAQLNQFGKQPQLWTVLEPSVMDRLING